MTLVMAEAPKPCRMRVTVSIQNEFDSAQTSDVTQNSAMPDRNIFR